jgi:hypothetical protein
MRTTTCSNEYELRLQLGRALNDLRTAIERCNAIGTAGLSDAEAENRLAVARNALKVARSAAASLESLEFLTLESELILAYGEPTFDTIECVLINLEEPGVGRGKAA